jgi:myosin heavy subunit
VSQCRYRCIKPNETKAPNTFNGRYISKQLGYLGVPSVIAIHQAGYPFKFTLRGFIARYRCIAFDQPKLIAESLGEVQVCRNLLSVGHALTAAAGEQGWIDALTAQIGKTKVRIYSLKPCCLLRRPDKPCCLLLRLRHDAT